MRVFDRLLDVSRRLSLWAAWFGGALLIVAVLVVSLEVILRKGFGRSLGGADEISSYALAVGASWAFAYALFERSHIRVDVVYARLSPRVKAVLDLISLLVLAGVVLLLARYAYGVYATSYARGATANTPLGTPLWWPQGLWFMGLGWFFLVNVMIFLRSLIAFAAGDFETLERLAGSQVIEDELESVAALEHGEG